MIDELIEIGKISGAAGIRGELKLYHYSGERERLAGVGELFLESPGGDPQPCAVVSVRYAGKTPILKLGEVTDRSAAEALRGRRVFAREGDLAPLDADSYYVKDLIGASVCDASGNALGTVSDIIDNPAHDLLVIESAAETENITRKFMLPFVDVFILAVERNVEGFPVKITASLPDGLTETGG
ncbi:MAG: ribosome maturation factor RimM [Clostridiales Family XIII bacterium]|nr:ribosome maturation factor RimM [Clostridiales Family XIII bacterium]